ncbi:MAG: Histidinol-phosphatase, partial [Clostridium butyricum DORA_1]
DRMNDYFEAVIKVKEKYKDKIKINLGMEVDFIDGLEENTINLLNEYGPSMEDGILSVHFIKLGDEYTAIDWKEGFEKAVTYYGTVEKVYDKYYETLLKAVKYDLGEYKPKRIGHPNLIRIFNRLL